MPVAVIGPNRAPRDPGAAVTPIFLEKEVPGVFEVIGTGASLSLHTASC